MKNLKPLESTQTKKLGKGIFIALMMMLVVGCSKVEPILTTNYTENKVAILEYGQNLEEFEPILTLKQGEYALNFTKMSLNGLDSSKITKNITSEEVNDLKNKTPEEVEAYFESKSLKAEETKEATVTVFDDKEEEIASTTFKYIVIDTELPKIEGTSEYTTEVGKVVDYKTGIKATDSVEGDLEIAYSGEVDYSKAGEYKVEAKAEDKNGNVVTQGITIIVKEKEVAVVETPKQPTTQTPNNQTTTKPSQNTSPTKPNNSGSTNTSGSQTSKPTESNQNYVCPTGTYKTLPCDAKYSPKDNIYYGKYDTMELCKQAGHQILAKWLVYEGKEITNFACREVSRNDVNTGTWFGLELMHNGQYWLLKDNTWISGDQ